MVFKNRDLNINRYNIHLGLGSILKFNHYFILLEPFFKGYYQDN